ncbi:MAG: ABC transporter substrate-binding protein [Synergistaceae bacterium]|nr:ABC transporter substrate-binding protein [Synergistaceae bacterium]
MIRIIGIILMILTFTCNSYAETRRIISLYPGHSDNIYALGGGDMLIALSENDDDDLLPELPRISLRTGAERILSLHPDIVITRGFAERINPNLYDVLRRSGVKVISIDPPDWDNFPDYLKALAHELNLDSESAIMKLNALTESIKSRSHSESKNHPHVFLEAASREIHTCSPSSWAARLIELAGGINIAHDAKPLRTGSAIAAFGAENVLKHHEVLDVYIIQTGAMNHAGIKDFYARSWSEALKNV